MNTELSSNESPGLVARSPTPRIMATIVQRVRESGQAEVRPGEDFDAAFTRVVVPVFEFLQATRRADLARGVPLRVFAEALVDEAAAIVARQMNVPREQARADLMREMKRIKRGHVTLDQVVTAACALEILADAVFPDAQRRFHA